ncbi:hypothetical protein CPB85DRAFT_1335163 [Mucidula mucida]|nr:hypothetical protein CPB85DRAFT_1335163 [Mucidula mucida]
MSSPIKARAFPCPYCPRVYALNRHLKRHVEIHDPKTKRFACPWDESTRHTNTKDIFCTKFAYATGDPALALRHQKRAHGYKPRTIRKRLYTISDAFSSSSGSAASSPTTPTAEVKPELDIWQLEYPFEDAFTNVQARPLYPAAEAIPALSFDVESLFSMESGYDWSLPFTNAESLVSSPDIWSSWAPTPQPTFAVESSPTSFDWSPSLDENRDQFLVPSPAPSSSFHSTPYSPSPAPYTEQSLEQFFSFALPEAYPSMNGAFPSSSPQGSSSLWQPIVPSVVSVFLLVFNLPPYVLSPRLTISTAPPSGQSRSASYVTSQVARQMRIQ